MYREQEGVTLPIGYYEAFCESIRDTSRSYLVGELNETVVCGGGVEYDSAFTHARLFFGIVRREMQRRGIGSTMLLARLAALDPKPMCYVTLEATPWTAPFFERIGFQWEHEETDSRGQVLRHGYLRLLCPHVTHMKMLLTDNGIDITRLRIELGGCEQLAAPNRSPAAGSR